MGRRKKKGVMRTRSGRISRSKAALEARGERDAALVQPHRRWLPPEKRADQDAESELGRLYLAGRIDEVEKWAGEKFRRLVHEFRQVMASPVRPQSASSSAVATSNEAPAEIDRDTTERAETDEERAERVIPHWNRVQNVMRPLGPAVWREVEAVAVEGLACLNLAALRAGLRMLVLFWRLDADRRPRPISGFVGERPGWDDAVEKIELGVNNRAAALTTRSG